MDRIEEALTALAYTLNTRKKRHIAGGILISSSLFFTGLAITVITLRIEDDNYE